MTVEVRKAEPRDAEAAAGVLRRSITELCTLDHHGDADTLAKWLANKTPGDFLSWLAAEDNFWVVAEANGRIMGVGLLHRRGEGRLFFPPPGGEGRGSGQTIVCVVGGKGGEGGLSRLYLEIEDGVCLPESDAILNYLADGTPFLPSERLLRAQVLQWLFFEQYSHEPYIAVARYIIRFLGRPEKFESKLQEKMAPGYAALQVMETHLANRRFFVAERYTIADIGLYAYTHVAHEGSFELSPYPAVRAWLERVRSQPGHITMRGE